jgi:hypothetical protein
VSPSRKKRKPSSGPALSSPPTADESLVDHSTVPASLPTDSPSPEGTASAAAAEPLQSSVGAQHDAEPQPQETVVPTVHPAVVPPIPQPAPRLARQETPLNQGLPRHKRAVGSPLLDLLVTPLTVGVVAALQPLSWFRRRFGSPRVGSPAGR